MKRVLCAVLAAAFSLSCVLSVSADYAPDALSGAYGSYVYDSYGTPVKSPDGYKPLYERIGTGSTALNNPTDLFCAPDGNIYIADTGNNRILVLDGNLNYVRQITEFENNFMVDPLDGPQGVFVSKSGQIYISDTGNKRIVVLDRSLNMVQVVEEPHSELISSKIAYKPTRLVADSAGRIYVLAYGNYNGLLRFDAQGKFDSYYASNKVQLTPQLALQRFWKKILTRSQRELMEQALPIEYSGVDIDPKDFVYTSVSTSSNSTDELKKINPLGEDVLTSGIDFGDLDYVAKKGVRVDTSFTDVDVDSDGFINGLDLTRGRIFEYDQEGNLLFAFGTLGNQLGAFKQPQAIDSCNGKLYVLDAGRSSITVFGLTEYGSALRRADVLNENGEYAAAGQLWDKVLKMDANLELAYSGKGRALLHEDRYREAMTCFKLANDKTNYDMAFQQVRQDSMGFLIPLIGVLVILALLLPHLIRLIRRAVRKGGSRA